ncbi:Hypothetical protein I595_37 [Croceitalea dokdonensis DOKDO 023]|uniref:Uncharacterized protein n=1 Tax=Croceitalea dokdonensis DOKDO 023 TaxID=1300341 RepID=A0A0P7AY43_9FLAO|nr:Hypothetical protein I595_37 [Croceitalea dokdonensis DOKDO 023]
MVLGQKPLVLRHGGLAQYNVPIPQQMLARRGLDIDAQPWVTNKLSYL